jgi:hypothetical protein
MMTNSNAKGDLIARLNAALSGTAFAVREGEEGCVLVERQGFLRGIWHCHEGTYAWIPGGYSEPTEVFETPDAIVEHTLRRTAQA